MKDETKVFSGITMSSDMTIYTVPSNRMLIITEIVLCNSTEQSSLVTIKSNSLIACGNILSKDDSVTQRHTQILEGKELIISSAIEGIDYYISALEVDA